MGMGIGAAMTGLRPIVEGMNMGFLLLAYNQISNNAGMLHYTSGGQYKVCSVADVMSLQPLASYLDISTNDPVVGAHPSGGYCTTKMCMSDRHTDKGSW